VVIYLKKGAAGTVFHVNSSPRVFELLE